MKYDPKPYQPGAVEFVKRVKRGYLDAGIGSGKTVIALTAINDLWLLGEVDRVLVLSTVNVILNTFPDELRKWDHTQGMSYSTLHGDKKDEAILEDTFIHLSNYEGLPWLASHPDRPWYDMVVLDEAHLVKDSRTGRFDLLKDMLEPVPRILLMSGTSIGNSMMDLWSQYYLLDRGRRLFRDYEDFRCYYFKKDPWKKHSWQEWEWTKPALVKKVADITYQIEATDVVLPELREELIPIDLGAELTADYKRFERDFFMEIDDVPIEAFNAASLCQKLRQYANGFLYGADRSGPDFGAHWLHEIKYQALRELVRQAGDTPIMLVCSFQADFAQVQRYFPGAACVNGRTTKAQNRKVFQQWNAGDLGLMAIHPRSAGTGLNLQDGGSWQIHVSPDWSLLAKKQTIGRLRRVGQEAGTVWVRTMVALQTIDVLIVEALKKKAFTAEQFAKLLRSYKNKVLRGKL